MSGSLINMLQAGSKSPDMVVAGMGATMLLWTDRHAATVTTVYSQKRIGVTRDKAIRVDKYNMTDSGQRYEYVLDPTAPEQVYTLRKNGRWVGEGETMKGGSKLAVGYKDEYYDYSF